MIMQYLLAFCRISIGFVFLISFVAKARDLQVFTKTITSFSLVPKQLNKLVAVIFLTSEFTVVLLIFFGHGWLNMAFLLATCLLLIFSIALITVLIRKLQASCNCFGLRKKPISHYDLWRNAGFILCALAGWWAVTTSQSSIGVVEWTLVSVMAIGFVLVWIHLGDIITVFRSI